jgi:hypothetical protein
LGGRQGFFGSSPTDFDLKVSRDPTELVVESGIIDDERLGEPVGKSAAEFVSYLDGQRTSGIRMLLDETFALIPGNARPCGFSRTSVSVMN